MEMRKRAGKTRNAGQAKWSIVRILRCQVAPSCGAERVGDQADLSMCRALLGLGGRRLPEGGTLVNAPCVT